MSVSLIFSGNGDLSANQVPALSAACEEKGFRGVWFGETTVRDAGVLSSLALASTKRIEVGTSILNVYTRTPGQLAMLAATLNELGGGRFTLGVGASTPAIVSGWHGARYERPLKMVEESVKLLRMYLSGERFTYKGAFYSPTNARLRVAGPTKIAVAALNEKMIGLAGRVADRVILNLYPPDMIGEAKRILREANPNSKVELSVMLYAYVLGEGERGMQASKDLIMFYSSSEAYARLFKRAGFEREATMALQAWQNRDREAVRRSITEEMVRRLMVYGDMKALRERVKAYLDEGVDDVMIAPCPTGDYLENAKQIIEKYF